jgi:hypothetical protein
MRRVATAHDGRAELLYVGVGKECKDVDWHEEGEEEVGGESVFALVLNLSRRRQRRFHTGNL